MFCSVSPISKNFKKSEDSLFGTWETLYNSLFRKFIRNSILNENTVSALIFDRHRCHAQSRCVLEYQKPSALSRRSQGQKTWFCDPLSKKKKKNIQYTSVRGNINRTDVPYQKFGAIRITRACNPFHQRSKRVLAR